MGGVVDQWLKLCKNFQMVASKAEECIEAMLNCKETRPKKALICYCLIMMVPLCAAFLLLNCSDCVHRVISMHTFPTCGIKYLGMWKLKETFCLSLDYYVYV